MHALHHSSLRFNVRMPLVSLPAYSTGLCIARKNGAPMAAHRLTLFCEKAADTVSHLPIALTNASAHIEAQRSSSVIVGNDTSGLT